MNVQTQPVYISLEFTPNPNTLKYSVNRELIPAGAVNITSAKEAAEKSPLGVALYKINGIEGIMIGRDFITITKADSGDWDKVHREASLTIEAFLNEHKAVVNKDALPPSQKDLSSDAIKIQNFLEQEVRPAVAMDGGDISFDRYEEGVVYVHLQGSCAGCPSATATLKQGIEVKLKQILPEIKEVVAVN